MLVAFLAATTLAACVDTGGSDPQHPPPSPGGMGSVLELEREEYADGIAERVELSLMERELDVAGVTHRTLQTRWVSAGLTHACNLDMRLDLPNSAFGQQRRWRTPQMSSPSGRPELEVYQLVGAFGMPQVVELVDYVRSLLTCETYVDRQGDHVMLGEIALPGLDGVDAAFGFCERTAEVVFRGELTRETRHQCTVILGRDDVATRIQVDAEDLERARQVATEVAGVAARVLSSAW